MLRTPPEFSLLFELVNSNLTHNNGPFLDTLNDKQEPEIKY